MGNQKNTSAEYPEFFARFYDVIYDHIRAAEDHDYFMEKILNCKGRVLEVGTGTGRFFREALKKGADIYGIDISPSMIEILKNNLDPEFHHRVSVDDIRDFKSEEKFDLIIAPFRVFMHLIEVEDQLKALNNIASKLKDDGLFIFDLFVPNLPMLISGLDEVKDFDGEYAPGKKLERISSMKADLIRQISQITFIFNWEEGGKMKSKTWETELRFFFRYELEHLIRQSQLKLENIFGNFKEEALSNASKEFIVHCRCRW
jgi:SAM-dependent methyltransferase